MNELRNQTIGEIQPDEAAGAYIAGRVKAGASRKAIIQELIQRGYDPSVAREMVGGVTRKHASSTRKSGLLYLIAGILITTTFLALTITSYTTASQQGGTYVIYWGLIIFGLYMTIRGVVQLIRGREVK
jgi:hypothetical protein